MPQRYTRRFTVGIPLLSFPDSIILERALRASKFVSNSSKLGMARWISSHRVFAAPMNGASGLAVAVLLDICRCTGNVIALRELILADPKLTR
jgi:hypothetical protein